MCGRGRKQTSACAGSLKLASNEIISLPRRAHIFLLNSRKLSCADDRRGGLRRTCVIRTRSGAGRAHMRVRQRVLRKLVLRTRQNVSTPIRVCSARTNKKALVLHKMCIDFALDCTQPKCLMYTICSSRGGCLGTPARDTWPGPHAPNVMSYHNILPHTYIHSVHPCTLSSISCSHLFIKLQPSALVRRLLSRRCRPKNTNTTRIHLYARATTTQLIWPNFGRT
jgi:hypothetical protein